MLECVSFTLTTLQSLLQLLDEVKNMVISDDIQQEVSYHGNCFTFIYFLKYKTYPIQCICVNYMYL